MQTRISRRYSLLLFLLFFKFITSQNVTDHLPEPPECGTLRGDQFYNQKNIAELDEFPWLGRIAYRLNEGAASVYLCAATLISRRHLLTTAACFRFEEEAYAVLLGDWNAANTINEADCDDDAEGTKRCAPLPVLYEIAEIIVHRHYNAKLYANNIALLRLAKAVVFSSSIRPICLPGRDVAQLYFAGQHLTLTGWYKDISSEPRKTKTFVHIRCMRSCARINGLSFATFFPNNNSHLCGFSCRREAESRRGSSSALMGVAAVDGVPSSYYLIGIIAYGRKNCSTTFPDIFTRIDGHLDWVRENL